MRSTLLILHICIQFNFELTVRSRLIYPVHIWQINIMNFSQKIKEED